jgi:acyl-coenzyme A thioesterase PaaI-like protein
MNSLTNIFNQAQQSNFRRFVLNQVLAKTIPFNKPHGFKIASITDSGIQTFLPYKKVNLNHIKGMHACALATLSEFTCGVQLIRMINPKEYRIILQKLEMEYHYQAKTAVTLDFDLSKEKIDTDIIQPLTKEDKIVRIFKLTTKNAEGIDICTATVHWQIKAWKNVKTKV